MAHPNKDIEITNIKKYLIHEHDYLLFGECTPKQRRVAEILEQAIWDINKIHKEWDEL